MERSTGKLEPIKNEDFRKVENYFSEKSIHTCRIAFRIRSQMVKEIPGNKKKYKNNDSSDSGLICKHCSDGFIMTQSHCRVEGAEGGSGPEEYQGLRHVLQEVARGESQAGEGK